MSPRLAPPSTRPSASSSRNTEGAPQARRAFLCSPGALATFGLDGLTRWLKSAALGVHTEAPGPPLGAARGESGPSGEGPVEQWLKALGWTVIDPVGPARLPHRWLQVSSGSVVLMVLIAAPERRDAQREEDGNHDSFDAAGGRDATHEAHRRALEEGLLRSESRVGLLFTRDSVSFVLRDEQANFHELVEGEPESCNGYLELSISPPIAFGQLCTPRVVDAAADLAQCILAHRRDWLKGFGVELVRGLVQFIDEVCRAPTNRPRIAAHTTDGDVALTLWHQGLLFAFGALILIREEHLCRPASPKAETAHGQGWLGQLLEELELENGAPDASSSNDARYVHHCAQLFDRVSEALRPASLGALDSEARGDLERFALLRSLRLPENTCREWLRTLFFDPENPTRKRGRSDARHVAEAAFTLPELARLFESFLEFRPSFAARTMVRVRRHGRELVVPSDAEQPALAELRPRPPGRQREKAHRNPVVGTLPEGSFYVTDVHGRKGAGAYYTPRAIASTLTRQAIAQRLDAFDAQPDLDLAAFFPWFRTLDPTMGAGVFLLEAATQLGDALFERLLRQPATVPFIEAPEGTRPSAVAMTCRVACTTRCLYGMDRHPVAVHIARLALWSHCGCTAEVASALAEHFVVGDALIGPRLEDLESLPVKRSPLPDDAARLLSKLRLELMTSGADGATDGGCRRTLAVLSEAWSGAAQSGCAEDDDDYLRFLRSLHSSERQAEVPRRRAMTPRHLAERALCFDVCFPEVFRPESVQHRGFGLVLGNPPWDSVKHNQRELLATLDLRATQLPTQRERERLVSELRTSSEIADEMDDQVEAFERLKRVHDRLYRHQKRIIEGDLAGRQLDLFRLFIERAWSLLSDGGILGFVVPSAFHTAAGAAGVRKLIFESGSLLTYAVLRNCRRWFDISTGLEFGLLVARRGNPKEPIVRFRFGLLGPEPLTGATPWLTLPRAYFDEKNPYCTLPSVETEDDLRAIVCLSHTMTTWSDFARSTRVELRSTPTSLHRTHEAKHFLDLPVAQDPRLVVGTESDWPKWGAPIHEGATFGRFDDRWGSPPKYALSPERIRQVPRYAAALGHYRLVMRAIVGSSPHKSIAAMITPGTLVANSALVEGFPEARPSALALVATAVLNSSVASFLLLASADLNVNLFALRRMAWPRSLPNRFLAHGALRLLTNHVGWLPLYREQLNGADSESPPAVPCIEDQVARRKLHGALDAAVAHAYGLSRADYAAVLSHFGEDSTFPHGLDAFAALAAKGEDFYREHDPLYDVELVETLPRPWMGTPIQVN